MCVARMCSTHVCSTHVCSALFGAFLFRTRPRREIFLCDVVWSEKKKHTMIKLGCGPKDSTPVKFTYSFAVLIKLE